MGIILKHVKAGFLDRLHIPARGVFVCRQRDSKPGEQNGPVERFARPRSESSPGAQHGVQAKDDLSGESHHRHHGECSYSI